MERRTSPRKKKTLAHNDVKATKVSTYLLKYYKLCRCWLIKHEVIPGFIVTMLGVWAAFWLTGLGEQYALNKTTRQRLNFVFLESEHNAVVVSAILNDFAEADVASINIGRLDSSATTAAFQDANILSFLSLERVSFLRTYINSIRTLNQAMQTYQRVFASEGYRTTSRVEKMRQLVHSNAAVVAADGAIIQQELEEHLDESAFDKEKLKNMGDRRKQYKESALKGKFSVSYE